MTTVAELAELAEELIKRAVRDLQGQGPRARDAWAWLMLPELPGDTKDGWDLDDACAILGTEPETVRRALLKRGFTFPPTIQQYRSTRHGRPKHAGVITCKTCGVPVPTADVPTTRTCVACGRRYQQRYLKLRGLTDEKQALTSPRRSHAAACLRLLLQHGPLPRSYVYEQLTRAGFGRITIERARNQVRPVIQWTAEGRTTWRLPPGPGCPADHAPAVVPTSEGPSLRSAARAGG